MDAGHSSVRDSRVPDHVLKLDLESDPPVRKSVLVVVTRSVQVGVSSSGDSKGAKRGWCFKL